VEVGTGVGVGVGGIGVGEGLVVGVERGVGVGVGVDTFVTETVTESLPICAPPLLNAWVEMLCDPFEIVVVFQLVVKGGEDTR
jgi:hypothetical protein